MVVVVKGKTLECLRALQANAESERLAKDGKRWGMVYLDNAKPKDLSGRQWAAYLGQLAKKGLYIDIDEYAWGEVLIDGVLIFDNEHEADGYTDPKRYPPGV